MREIIIQSDLKIPPTQIMKLYAPKTLSHNTKLVKFKPAQKST